MKHYLASLLLAVLLFPTWAGPIVERNFYGENLETPTPPWPELRKAGEYFGVDLTHFVHTIVSNPDKAKRKCEIGQDEYFKEGRPSLDWRIICTTIELTEATYVWAKSSLSRDEFMQAYIAHNVFQRWSPSTPKPTARVVLIREEKGIAYYHGTGGAYNQKIAVFSVPTRIPNVVLYMITQIHGDHAMPQYADDLLRSHIKQLAKHTHPNR